MSDIPIEESGAKEESAPSGGFPVSEERDEPTRYFGPGHGPIPPVADAGDRERIVEKVAEVLGATVTRRGEVHVRRQAEEVLDAFPWVALTEEEREALRAAVAEAVIPLEVIAGQDRMKPYRELSRELIVQVDRAIYAIRDVLPVLSKLRGSGGAKENDDD